MPVPPPRITTGTRHSTATDRQRASSSTVAGAATRSPKQDDSSRLRIGLYQKKSRERFFTIEGVSKVSMPSSALAKACQSMSFLPEMDMDRLAYRRLVAQRAGTNGRPRKS
ncbi:hypothetical protein RFM41_04260 [Mesorhizobium sp. VK25A]|uniref:KTSC domain-containing protein n=1 Tax=Mesorhizobium vachelliae TaxID=3072309 RepID=A0ABU5A4Y9_9HYPH|nr:MULTISPECIES: hypothetical protein [unclassified Mesorhizobium]MDX8531313.1 hypothetical protein [Mesorhizobium sp. VK25D]MDX8542936.1 hypothetical protein [Mesorhizobium sp. VK25A]